MNRASMNGIRSQAMSGLCFDLESLISEFNKISTLDARVSQFGCVRFSEAASDATHLIKLGKKQQSMASMASMAGTEASKDLANVHHLWQSGLWTSAEQAEASFCNKAKDNCCFNLFRFPLLSVIEPKSLGNINSLGRMSKTKHNKRSKTKAKNGSFKTFAFFSEKATDALCLKLGCSPKDKVERQNLYQFEARYFQYSVLRCNIRFVKDYRNNKEYLVFKFGHPSELASELASQSSCSSSQVASSDGDLYAICEENNFDEAQPWFCQHIFTLPEMLRFFELENSSLSVKEGFLSHVSIGADCVSKTFNTAYECKSHRHRITQMLKRGYVDYQRAKESRGYYCDDMMQGTSSACLGKTNSVGGMSNGSSASSECSYSSSSSPALSVSSYGYDDCGSMRGRHESRNRHYGRRQQKIKNEDKFDFLNEIGLYFGWNERELLENVGDAIETAFEFARRNPQTALTQAYIDEDHESVDFELVILAEIADPVNERYFKFAVPISECSRRAFYTAQNILTPKMVQDNVRLNSVNAQFDDDTWIADMCDRAVSFYQRVEPAWYMANKEDSVDSVDSVGSMSISGVMVTGVDSVMGDDSSVVTCLETEARSCFEAAMDSDYSSESDINVHGESNISPQSMSSNYQGFDSIPKVESKSQRRVKEKMKNENINGNCYYNMAWNINSGERKRNKNNNNRRNNKRGLKNNSYNRPRGGRNGQYNRRNTSYNRPKSTYRNNQYNNYNECNNYRNNMMNNFY